MKFFNRELSWLSFNERVLMQSCDANVPLIERLRFLGIYSNNMDEFYRVRVASVRKLASVGMRRIKGIRGTAQTLLKKINKEVLEQQKIFDKSYQSLLHELRDEGIAIVDHKSLNEDELQFVKEYFRNKVRSQIVPIILSKKRVFPQLKDGGNYLAIKLSLKSNKKKYALVQILDNFSRFVVIPSKSNNITKVILLDDIIRHKLANLFSIFDFVDISAYSFKITRDAELEIDDYISKSYLDQMKEGVALRKEGDAVRFVYDKKMPQDLLDFLLEEMNLDESNLIPGGTYHNFRDFMSFPSFNNKKLIFPKRFGAIHSELKKLKTPLLEKILTQDILVSYPFQTFQHVVDVLREAAIDSKVRSIKINLYRVASNSQIINALINAAQNGIKVTVILELKARFDESNNIKWSKVLTNNGVDVLFGIPNLKVHSKLFLIKRKVKDKTQFIAHIGTGNFHEKTANLYTDCSLLTANSAITKEVEKVFSLFKNNLERSVFKELVVSPFNVRRKFYALINNEIKLANQGKKAEIMIKLNNLMDDRIINKLYQASKAGVKITCIIRGICALVPAMPFSKNITVKSVVGRYLEHTRILIFHNNGDRKYFISSADWMTRNIDKRIEVGVPIYDKKIQQDLQFMFDAYLKDSQKSTVINATQDNSQFPLVDKQEFNAQDEIYRYFHKQ